MKRRDVIAALILTLAAGGAAASSKPEKNKPEKKKAGGESFLQMGGTSATVMKAGGKRGVLAVETGLDIPDDKLREHALASTPRLRAAYAQALRIYAAGLTPAEPPDPEILSRELQRQTNIVLGKPGARLLLGSIILN